uniref:uncharacterized protein LOC123998023 n=1 Tax=Oncorhynchus gorbuscha TaxID=8017 RepID=UPI001EAF3DFC|nr:uncharacterized protein LOC123998023 [Oncorhynchus gorbuscha]
MAPPSPHAGDSLILVPWACQTPLTVTLETLRYCIYRRRPVDCYTEVSSHSVVDLIPISSEGLGCSNLSSSVSIDEPVRRPIITSLISSTTVVGNLSSADLYFGTVPKLSVVGPPDPCTRPEGDILFQWRLRRKMEKASQWSHPHQVHTLHQHSVSWQAHKVQRNPHPAYSTHIVTRSFTPAPQETSVPHGPFSPAAALPVSKLQPDTPVCPHMQLLCDILPYTAQCLSPPPSHQRSPNRRSLGPTGPSGSPKPSSDPQTPPLGSPLVNMSPLHHRPPCLFVMRTILRGPAIQIGV